LLLLYLIFCTPFWTLFFKVVLKRKPLESQGNFAVEHLWHHRTVGTSKDPDTAKLNEGLYGFWLRSIPKGWVDCWSWRPMKTKMLALTGLQVGLNGLIYIVFGIQGLLFFLTQGLVTILLLKWINYVEHYGVRRKTVQGRLEPVRREHSWDCTSPLTNFSLFNLGFHSQHHMKASIPYHELPDSKDHWNELPYGYSAMMVIALVPPLWRKLMNPRVEKAFSYES
jgi:alkane 1-monooxygenase